MFPVSGLPARVQVFSLGVPSPGTPREQRRYRVKWRLEGRRDKTRAFKTRVEAERFRTAIQTAAHDGLPFDQASGLPLAWLDQGSGPTWWAWSREWLGLKWPQWSGHSRRAGVETLALFAPLLIRADAPPPPDALGPWLRSVGYRPGDLEASTESAWLERWSVPLVQIEPALLEHALRAVTTKADGATNVVAVVRRRRNALGTVLRSAVRRGLLDTNPLDRVEWRSPARSLAIDVSTVPSPADIALVVDDVESLRTEGRRYSALFAAVGMAGMRPSEAIGLLVRDIDLPETGWGMARLRGALTAPGGRFTADGEVAESKGLKQRPVGAIREVPLAPDLVARLKRHLDAFDPLDGRIFSNLAGRPVTPTNYGPVWGRARARLWPTGHALAKVTVYDLRHAAATMMLRAGVPPAEVARRLGHSVDVLMRVYAGVFDDERDRSNELIEAAMRVEPSSRPTHP
jgi:integrase